MDNGRPRRSKRFLCLLILAKPQGQALTRHGNCVTAERRRFPVWHPPAMHDKNVRWYTRHLSREFDMLVFGHAGFPVILFPTSLGRYYQNKDFGLVGSV